ncbi:class II aaRS and biotin synthetase [Ascodesmis nigricans]|uniref:proline--tRNA ligase n=1 Tax=Ascodesmis nigricans TaxID=341454 RepID=A0A4S2N1B3_9PEZI|nr:class II aaRS and biotin synthetase [Ascodesmis nigricans]
MRSIGAARLSLSTITSEALWEKTGRSSGSELFRLKDRKGSKLLLAPTHEEEITQLLVGYISHRYYPLRLYQIGRKYRDERRPRAGLLRGREFLMKDLYTFDTTEQAALDTYRDVQGAYKALFDELKLPYLVASADSGSMGGSLSHEYLYPSTVGEDTIVSCSDCGYTANLEAVVPKTEGHDPTFHPTRKEIAIHHSITRDRKTLINSFYLASASSSSQPINLSRLATLVPDLDPSTTDAVELFEKHYTPFDPAHSAKASKSHSPPKYSQIINVFDAGLPSIFSEPNFSNHMDVPAYPSFIADKTIPSTSISRDPHTDLPLRILRVNDGDPCPKCDSGKLTSTTAIELAHTFHLGTRYTEPLNAEVQLEDNRRVPLHQGCHGIGVSRMIAAIAEGWRDGKGLNWPRVVAPYDVMVVAREDMELDGRAVYDALVGEGGDPEGKSTLDVLFDDRTTKDLIWKMTDADALGFPVICVVGRGWKNKEVEVQCRRKGLKMNVPLAELKEKVEEVLTDL